MNKFRFDIQKNNLSWEKSSFKKCDSDKCNKKGEYRAPKSRIMLNEYFYFCLHHIKEYNKSWDFYKGMSVDQIETSMRNDTVWDRPSWPLKDNHGSVFDKFNSNVDDFIKLKRDNMKVLCEIDEIDLLLAKVMYDVKTKQNYSNSEDSLVKLVKTKFNKISKQNNLLKSTRFRIRLFNMYSRLLLQKRDYKALESFVIKSYDEFENEKLFDRSNHNDKLTILTYIANCLFKTNKNNQSLKYAELLLNSMKEYDCLLYDKYLFFYYNILVSNYSVTDKEKALNYLDKASNNEVIKKLQSYNSFIY